MSAPQQADMDRLAAALAQLLAAHWRCHASTVDTEPIQNGAKTPTKTGGAGKGYR
jgi:hypothetical protein